MTARRLLVVPALVVLTTCSTLAPQPAPEECNEDDDCDTAAGFKCHTDALVCVPGDLVPPRAHLAFDIQEFDGSTLVTRSEVKGCDQLVKLEGSDLTIERANYQQQFELAAYLVEPSTPPLVEELLPIGSELELSQSSRLANRPPTLRRRVSYPVFEDEMMTTLSPTVVRFPRYPPEEEVPAMLGPEGFILWQVVPAPDAAMFERAPMYQMLVPPVTQGFCTGKADCCPEGDEDCPNYCYMDQCTLIGNPRFVNEVVYDDESNRELAGEVLLVRADGSTFIGSEVSVQLRHADDPDATTATRLGVYALSDLPVDARGMQCDPDDPDASCIPGESYCEPVYSQCKLALAGRAASTPRTTDATGTFSARAYDYRFELADDNYTRWFTATVSRSTGAVPSTSARFPIFFPPNEGAGMWDSTMEGDKLCMPDWGTPITAEVRIKGDPVDFVGTGPGAFRCCDVGCLPRTPEEAAMLGAPPRATECDGTTAAGSVPSALVTAPARLGAAEEEQWTTLGCVMPTKDDAGNIGALTREVDCVGGDEGSTCTLTDLGAADDGGAREYALRIESPVGSVLRSVSMSFTVDAEAPVFQHDITLPTRVLLRGTVRTADSVCDPGTAAQTGCGSEGALVLAERIRMPGEDPVTTVGPFFHEVSTFFDPVAGRPGAYVLPLDPGVYAVTALPASGSPGGPADIEVIDLRTADTEERLDFVLRPGVLVSLDIGPGRGPLVTPLDIGSWKGALDRPDALGPIDLNLVGECLTPPEEGALACKIRRLIPSANLPPNQTGIVRFTARAAAGSSGNCAEG